MKYVILFFILFSTSAAAAAPDCTRHPIYCKIVEINPSIDRGFAMELSNIIYRAAILYKIDPMISVAIAAQESGIRNINREAIGVYPVCEVHAHVPCHTFRTITDVGIFQIHVKTAENYGMDIFKLLNSVEYQVVSHMKILKQKLKLCADLGDEAYSCYHSKTPKYRKAYVKHIKKYLQ